MVCNIKLLSYLILLGFIKGCFKNVHITLGDAYANPKSEITYRIGLMLNNYKDRACWEGIRAVLTYVDGTTQEFKVTKQNHYSFHGDPDSAGIEAVKEKAVDIERTFVFIDLKQLTDKSEFSYSLYYNDALVKGPFEFKTNINKNLSKSRIVSFGDHDIIKGMPTIRALENHDYDLMILLGDYSYNIHDENGKKGDHYFEAMEKILTKAPVILVTGNHEYADRYRLFASRFVFPLNLSESTNNYFHFVIGNTLFIAFNFDTFVLSDKDKQDHWDWLTDTIAKYKNDDTIENRLFYSHRPFLCTNNPPVGTRRRPQCRTAIWEYKKVYDLLLKNQFKAAFSAHQHYYERLKPTVGYEINYKGLTQVLTGTGGNDDLFIFIELPKSEIRVSNYQLTMGFTEAVISGDKIICKFINAEGNKLLEEFVIGEEEPHSRTFLTILIIISLLVIAIGIHQFLLKRDKPDIAEMKNRLQDNMIDDQEERTSPTTELNPLV